jgi:hypothetical protein
MDWAPICRAALPALPGPRPPALTPEERERLRARGGCFRCRKLGHMAAQCPNFTVTRALAPQQQQPQHYQPVTMAPQRRLPPASQRQPRPAPRIAVRPVAPLSSSEEVVEDTLGETVDLTLGTEEDFQEL